MKKETIKVIKEKRARGALLQVLETNHEFDRYYVLVINGEPRVRSADLNLLNSA